MTAAVPTLHASCVALDGQGVLLAGEAGVGKSDVALRLLDAGATLVADDRTALTAVGGVLMAAAPAAIEGLIEVRQIGLYRQPFVKDVPVALYVELAPPGTALERLPEPAFFSFLDCRVPALKLVGCEASTPAKIRIALQGVRLDD